MNRDETLAADPLTKLRESDLHANPIVQFHHWFEQANLSGVCKPTAMTLATSSPGGLPSARIVLLRDADESGFNFFPIYEGPKARDLEANPHAALLFYWAELERQIRIEGTVSRLSAAESGMPTIGAEHARVAWVRGCRRKARWYLMKKSWNTGGAGWSGSTRGKTMPGLRSGEVTGSSPGASSSGKPA